MSSDSYASLTERLLADFEHRHRLSVITRVIRDCRTQLADVNPSALPELLERLARQRLSDLAPTTTAPNPPRLNKD